MSQQLDAAIQRLRRHAAADAAPPGAPTGRFAATKLSWRGAYPRLLCVSAGGALTTRHPDSLVATNAWTLVGADADVTALELAGEHADGGVLVLHLRRDKKGLGGRDASFAVRERGALLAALYEAVGAAAPPRGAPPPLGLPPPREFRAAKLRRGAWVACVLRVGPAGLERAPAPGAAACWRLPWRAAAAPAARLLAPAPGDPPGAFALFGREGRSPRVYAAAERDALLKAAQETALRCMGVQLAVDASSAASLTGAALLAAVAAAERERAAAPDEAPLGEWEVLRVSADVAAAGGAAARRRLVLSRAALRERRADDYEVAAWRPLAALAAVVRYVEEPTWLRLEWADGAPAALYVTPARDALAAALVDAAQDAAGRPVPVLPAPTRGGDPVVAARGQAPGAAAAAPPPSAVAAELERWACAQLGASARAFFAAGGAAASLAALALAGLTAAAVDADAVDAAPATPAANGAAAVLPPPANGNDSGSGSIAALAAFQRRVREFNATLPYAGVSTACRVEEPVLAALLAHLPRQGAAGAAPPLAGDEAAVVVHALQALQRLAAAPVLAAQLAGPAGGLGRVFAALACGHDHAAAEAARLLARLFAPAAARAGGVPWRAGPGEAPPPAETSEERAAARAAKSAAFVSDARAAALLAPLRGGDGAAALPPSPLLSAAVLEALAAAACEPGCRTTEPHAREALLSALAALGRPLLALFDHPSPRAADAAALACRAVAEGGAGAAAPMRAAALAEGATLRHLAGALGPPGARAALSRDLVALWTDRHPPAEALLARVLPPGLLRYLDAPRAEAPAEAAAAAAAAAAARAEAQRRAREAAAAAAAEGGHLVAPASTDARMAAPAPAVASREAAAAAAAAGDAASPAAAQPPLLPPPRVPPHLLAGGAAPPPPRPPLLRGNWPALWAAAARDHHSAGLIWNERTRGELRAALAAEEAALRAGRAAAAAAGAPPPAWNASDFRVRYPSLEGHLAVGGVYLRLLLDGGEPAAAAAARLPAPAAFFAAAHLHLLRLGDAGAAAAGGGAGDAGEERELCARAMAAVYSAHAAAIGPFAEGLPHLVALADATPSRGLRDRLLELLEVLVAPAPAAGGGERGAAAAAAARANAAALAEAGGLELLVDVAAAGAHGGGSGGGSAAVPVAAALLAAAPHEEELKVWFYYPPAAPAADGAGAVDGDGRAGPLTKAELRQLFACGAVGAATPVWAAGMPEPAPFGAVRELRWAAARGRAALAPRAAAAAALRALRAAAAAAPAAGVAPLPAAHARLASPRCLPHLAQLLLSEDPGLVAAAASLLLEIIEPNPEAMARLYRTGAFFFALAYPGSNLAEVAALLRGAHLRQAGGAAGGGAPAPPGAPLAARSALGGLLPESLLYVLEAQGAGAFAAALAGDADTPALVWTAAMRGGRLAPALAAHLGDLRARLAQRAGAEYEYAPCPPVSASAPLQYLVNLCISSQHFIIFFSFSYLLPPLQPPSPPPPGAVPRARGRALVPPPLPAPPRGRGALPGLARPRRTAHARGAARGVARGARGQAARARRRRGRRRARPRRGGGGRGAAAGRGGAARRVPAPRAPVPPGPQPRGARAL
jgi:DnaJ family protein C protein 13